MTNDCLILIRSITQQRMKAVCLLVMMGVVASICAINDKFLSPCDENVSVLVQVLFVSLSCILVLPSLWRCRTKSSIKAMESKEKKKTTGTKKFTVEGDNFDLLEQIVRSNIGDNGDPFSGYIVNHLKAYLGTVILSEDFGQQDVPDLIGFLNQDRCLSNKPIQSDGLKLLDTLWWKDVRFSRAIAGAHRILAQWVVRVLTASANDETIQQRGCLLLCNLAFVGNQAECLSIADRGGIDLVVQAMSRFPTNVDIQSDGAAALGRVGYFMNNLDDAVVNHATELVVAAMAEFGDVELMQGNGCFALGILANFDTFE